MTIAALVLIISAVSVITPENASAYQKNQATPQTSACGNEFMPINIGCQGTDSEIQGDENAAALTAQQTFPEVKLPPKTGVLIVFKEVECTSEVQNEFPDLCEPSAFTMNVQSANNPDPISFLGSDRGTPVSLKPGPYEVVETSGLPDEIGLAVGVSPDCKGVIEAGEKLTCTFTNSLHIVTPLTVFNEVRCPDGFACPSPSEFTINVAGNNPDPSSFPGSSTGTPVSLGPGMYEVTEIAPETPTGLIALPPAFSPDCSGDIQAGQELSCTITNQYIAAINVGNGPVSLEYSPATESIYVAGLSDDVIVIDSNGMVAGTIDIGNCDVRLETGDCAAIEYSPATESIYVANYDSNTVTVIDSSNTVVDTIDVGNRPLALEYSPATESIYVANRGADSVTVIDSSNTVLDTINVGSNPIALEYSPATESIYVGNEPGTVTVIDSSNTAVDTINVGSNPIALEYSPATESIYVANYGPDTVTVIDSSNTAVDTIHVGGTPVALEYNPATESTYVANLASETVTVIDSSDMVVDTIHVDDSPIFLEFSPATNNIYVYIPISGPNPTHAEVAVIDSKGIVVDTIDVGRAGSTLVSLNPYEYLEFSPATNDIYAVSRVSNDVIIIPP